MLIPITFTSSFPRLAHVDLGIRVGSWVAVESNGTAAPI